MTADQVDRCVTFALLDGPRGELEEAVTSRIPLNCLDEPVLARLARRAGDDRLIDSASDLSMRFRVLVECAVAHRLAGQRNPTGDTLVALLMELFRLEHGGDLEPAAPRLCSHTSRTCCQATSDRPSIL